MPPKTLVVFWFLLPVLLWGVLLPVRRRIHPVLVAILCLCAMIAGGMLIVGYVHALDTQLAAEIDKYEPGTPEAEAAAEAWASDSGRSFLILLSAPLTLIWYGGLFALLFGGQWMLARKTQAGAHVLEAVVVDEPEQRPVDDGNPYQSPIDK